MHYCLKALVAKGWVKAGKFTHNPDKSVYLYLLTPEGILQKSKLAIDFLGRKRAEYHRMQQDIAQLPRSWMRNTKATGMGCATTLWVRIYNGNTLLIIKIKAFLKPHEKHRIAHYELRA